ncbi:MAG: right-handed parallel beta-helix repeat-containing protein [Verrucomicrobiota bacterium]
MRQGILAVLLAISFACSAFGQGDLTPPGAPAPMMKTLQQVEPRTPITNLPYTISWPGSYYLTTNLWGIGGSHGIDIESDNVTIDLNGFELAGMPSSLSGIYNPGNRNLAVRNGTVQGWGQSGIDFSSAVNCEVRDVRASANGYVGIWLGKGSRIAGCSAGYNVYGLAVRDGSAIENSEAGWNTWGIYSENGCRIGGCVANENHSAGISVWGKSVISECTVFANGTNGIEGGLGTIIAKCAVGFNRGDGIVVVGDCQVRDNDCQGNGKDDSDGANIHATGDGNRIEGNHAEGADRGLDVDGTGNYVADNTVRGNTDNYDFVAGNQLNLLLGEVPETLDWPCSVKFAGTLICPTAYTNGITVNADDVTIDMAGHTLVGPGGTDGCGIYQSSNRCNLRVVNGMVTHWQGYLGPGMAGIWAAGVNSQLENVQAATNYYGIRAGKGSVLSACSAANNLNYGIIVTEGGTLSGCAASDNGAAGILTGQGSTLSDCVAYRNRTRGISTGRACGVSRCNASYNTGEGINADTSSRVSDCVANNNSSDGIEVSGSCHVEGNSCQWNGEGGEGAGIHATGSGNRIDGNQLRLNDVGLAADSSYNLVVHNTVGGNTTNFAIAANNATGIVISVTGGGTVSGDPWANIEF